MEHTRSHQLPLGEENPNGETPSADQTHTPMEITSEAPTQKIFIFGKSEATISCLKCGRVKKLDVSKIKKSHHMFRVKCRCNFVFNVLFEKRVHYRKISHLTGNYSITLDPDAWGCLLVVQNLSRNGIGFKTDGTCHIQEGDILSVRFTLDNEKQSVIQSNVIVRSVVKDTYIGAEFCNLDEHSKKELGFYMMP